MNTPMAEPPSEPTPGVDKGTLLRGFLLGWAVTVIACLISGGLVALIYRASSGDYGGTLPALMLICSFLPLVFQGGLMIWFWGRGQTRSLLGVLLTMASQLALGLLLVAACFGYFAFGGNMR